MSIFKSIFGSSQYEPPNVINDEGLFKKIVDSMTFPVCLINFADYSIIYRNDAFNARFADQIKNTIKSNDNNLCHKVINNSSAPCLDCPLKRQLTSFERYIFSEAINNFVKLSCSTIILKNRKYCLVTLSSDELSSVTNTTRTVPNMDPKISFIFDIFIEAYASEKNCAIDDAIFKSLDLLCKHFSVGSGTLYELIDNKFYGTYLWNTKELGPIRSTIFELPKYIDKIIWDAIKENKHYSIIQDVDTELDETDPLFRYCKLNEIKNLFLIPLKIEDEILGFVSFHNFNENEVGTLKDISKFIAFIYTSALYRQNKKIRAENYNFIDKLTGVQNRYTYFSKVKALMIQNNSVGFAFLDVNGLSVINKTSGVESGNKCLTELVETLKEFVSPNCIYRLGDDEFALVIEGLEQGEFNIKMNTLKAIFNGRHNISASIGYAYAHSSQDIYETMNVAQLELSERKRTFYKEHPSGKINSMRDDVLTIRNASDLKSLIDDNYFVTWLQPKYNASNNRLTSAEALTRLVINGKIYLPRDFLPLIESIQMSYFVDMYSLKAVCQIQKQCIDDKKRIVPIACNISHTTLIMANFVENLISLCDKYQIARDLIEIEISDNDNLSIRKELIRATQSLHSAGFKIILDKFGVSHANISSIMDLPLSTLKFDRRVINSLGKNDVKVETIFKGVVEISRQLNISTVAEGVETQEQLNNLKLLGCDEIQGFLLQRPVTIEEFLNLL